MDQQPLSAAELSPAPRSSQLLRVMGLGIAFAIAVGNTVGVGILRLPGEIAAALGDPSLIFRATCRAHSF
jgi:basic amino acid/polyamine antiporter, APA family